MDEDVSSLLGEQYRLEVEDIEKNPNHEIREDDIGIFEATLHLVKLAVPSWFALFFQILLEVINITFVGNLNDPNALAAVGLASLTINAFLFGPGYGIWGGIDTLVASAHGGNHPYLCGVYLNRGRLIQTAIVAPLGVVLAIFGKDLFLLMGQDDTVATMTHNYMWVALPGAFGALQFQITKRFMLAQKIFNPIVYFQVILLIQHLISSYLFIYYFEFGYIGAAIAHATTNMIAAICMTLALKLIPGIVPPESFHFFNKDSFTGWKEYLNYGFPSMMVTTLQWASFEAMGVYAGILGVNQLGAHTALANMHGFFHMIPLGMSFGSGACVGSSLGRGEYKMAKQYSRASYYLAWINSVLEIIILALFSGYIFRLYTQDPEMLSIMKEWLVFICLSEINSNLLGILKGLIKAMGRQAELARYSILINAVLANIFAVIICFYFSMGLPGIWLGFTIANSIGNGIFTFKLFQADWRQETQKALNRVAEDKKRLQN